MALLKITHFWSNLLAGGTRTIFQTGGTRTFFQPGGTRTFFQSAGTRTFWLKYDGYVLWSIFWKQKLWRFLWVCFKPWHRRHAYGRKAISVGEFFHNVAWSEERSVVCEKRRITPYLSQLRSFAISHSFVTFKGGYQDIFSIWGYQHNFLNLAWLPLVR